MAPMQQPKLYMPKLRPFGYLTKDETKTERDSLDSWLSDMDVSAADRERHITDYKASLSWAQWFRYKVWLDSPSDPYSVLLKDIVISAKNICQLVSTHRDMIREIRREENIYSRLRSQYDTCIEGIDAHNSSLDILASQAPLIKKVCKTVKEGFESRAVFHEYAEQTYSDSRWVWNSYLKESVLAGKIDPVSWANALVDRHKNDTQNAKSELELLNERKLILKIELDRMLPIIQRLRQTYMQDVPQLRKARDRYDMLLDTKESYLASKRAKAIMQECDDKNREAITACISAQSAMEQIDDEVDDMIASVTGFEIDDSTDDASVHLQLEQIKSFDSQICKEKDKDDKDEDEKAEEDPERLGAFKSVSIL